jgi:hypothetical protein
MARDDVSAIIFQSDCQPRKLCQDATCLLHWRSDCCPETILRIKAIMRGVERADEFGRTTSFVARGEMNPAMRGDEKADGLRGNDELRGARRGKPSDGWISAGGGIALDTH